MGTALGVFDGKSDTLDNFDIVSKKDLKMVVSSFRESLTTQLKDTLQSLRKEKAKGKKTISNDKNLVILSIIDTLTLIGADEAQLAKVREAVNAFIDMATHSELDVGKRLQIFMAAFEDKGTTTDFYEELAGDISTISGRQAVVEVTRANIEGRDNSGKLKLLRKALLAIPGDSLSLDRLLSMRQILLSIEGTFASSDLLFRI